jgi:hypothetical protein
MASSSIEMVRAVVSSTLSEMGIAALERVLFDEKALHRDAEHVGRRFQCQRVRAVWFDDAEAVDFFADDGHLLVSVPLPGQSAVRVAA